MKVEIEIPRYEEACALKIHEPLPEYLIPALLMNTEAMAASNNQITLPESMHVTRGVVIPIEAVYKNTLYKNHFEDFIPGWTGGVYLFTRGYSIIYIGSSACLVDRLRAHVVNYERKGLNSQSPYLGYTERILVFTIDGRRGNYQRLERYLIRKYCPVWNRVRYSS